MWPIKTCELDPDFICSKSSKYYSIWLCKCITTESPQHQPPREPKHTCSAVLKRKLTIEPIRPGSIARVHWSCVLTKRFQPFSQSLAGAFQIVGESADDNSYSDSGGKKDCSDSHAIVFEDLFGAFQERPRHFSFRDLCLQKRELFVSFCNSGFWGFFFWGRGVLILDDNLTLRSSNVFVLFSLSSMAFILLTLSLLTFAWAFSLFFLLVFQVLTSWSWSFQA